MMLGEFVNSFVIRICFLGAMPHTPFFRRTRYATALHDKRDVSPRNRRVSLYDSVYDRGDKKEEKR